MKAEPLSRSIQRTPRSSQIMALWALPFLGMEVEPGFSTVNVPPGSEACSHIGTWKWP